MTAVRSFILPCVAFVLASALRGQAPANDNFANAQLITGSSPSASGSNVAATGEPGEPIHVSSGGTASAIWYRWLAPASGTATVTTEGSSFDTVLAVYRGDVLGSLTAVASNDDYSYSFTSRSWFSSYSYGWHYAWSRVTFPVSAGVEYRIAIGGRNAFNGGSVRLNVHLPVSPTLVVPLQNQTVVAGSRVEFSIGADGNDLRYAWQRGSTPIPGANRALLVLENVTSSDADTYHVTVSNGLGSVQASASLAVIDPQITLVTPPLDTAVAAGQTAVLAVAATGVQLTYQWFRGPSGDASQAVAGATAATFTTPPIGEAASYWVRVANPYMSVDSAAATVSPALPAVIVAHSASQTVYSGSTATLTVTATGSLLGYQWYRGAAGDTSQPVVGATTASYTTLALTQPVTYWVRVSNAFGSASSAAIALDVVALPLDNWLWRNPRPQGDELRAVAHGGGRHVAVGAVGRILTSTDGLNWIAQPAVTTRTLRSVARGSDRFVAVGDNGTVLTSADGLVWTAPTSGTTTGLFGVVWDGAQFIAVGNSGVIRTSPDGETWTAQTSGTTQSLRAIASSGGRRVAVGLGGAIVTSTNGIDWTGASAPNAADSFTSVAASGALFVAAYGFGGFGVVFTSPDGVTWTERANGGKPESVIWTGLRWLGFNRSGVLSTSLDGIAWTTVAGMPPGSYHGAAVGGGQVTAVGAFGAMARSTDGLVWESVSRGTQQTLTDLIAHPAGYLGVGTGSTVVRSVNGLDWDSAVLSVGNQPGSSTKNHLNAVVRGGGQFVAVGTGGLVITSPDGADWTIRRSDTVTTFNIIAWNGTTFVAGGFDGTTGQGVIYSSTDAATWTPRTLTPATAEAPINDIAWNGAQFLAVGPALTVRTSPDGLTWTNRSSGVGRTLLTAHWDGAQFIATTDNGGARTSPDAITWTARTTGTFSPLRAIATGGGRVVAVGSTGLMMASSDGGVTWSPLAQRTANDLYSLIWDGQQFFAAGGAGTILSTSTIDRVAAPVITPVAGAYLTVPQVTITTSTLETTITYTVDGSDPAPSSTAYTGPFTPPAFGAVKARAFRAGWLASDVATAMYSQAAIPAVASLTPSGPVVYGNAARLSVEGTGGALSYQWFFGASGDTSQPVVGATSAAITTPPLVAPASYWVRLTNSHGATDSPAIALGVARTLPDTWTLRHPALPSGGLRAVAFGGGRFVAVGLGGRILHSTDGLNWLSAAPVTTRDLHAVAWTGARFVAVGVGGQSFHSTDGQAWSVRQLPVAATLHGLGVASGSVIAVGDSGAILASGDGLAWTVRSSGTTAHLRTVVRGADRFVVAGAEGAVRTSSDGIIWTARDSGVTHTFTGAAWNGAEFVLCAGEVNSLPVYTSPDGETWIPRTSAQGVRAVQWTGTRFVGVGHGGTVWSSATGATWTFGGGPGYVGTRTLFGLVWDGARAVAVGEGGAIAFSPDATNWLNLNPLASPAISAVASGGGVALGFGARGEVWRFEPDGAPRLVAWLPGVTLRDAVWTGSEYLAVGAGGAIRASSNGVVWTARVAGTASALHAIARGVESFVAVGAFGRIISSADGTEWTERTSGTTADVNDVIWTGTLFVAIGHGAAIRTSPDGVAWTTRTSGTTANLHALARNGSALVAVGAGGAILTSPDAVTWTTRVSGTTSALHAVARSGSHFVAAGADRVLRVSTDGVAWTPVTVDVAEALTALAWDGARFVAGGGNVSATGVADGTGWTTRQLAAPTVGLGAVASNGSAHLAVGGDTILASHEGQPWRVRVQWTGLHLRGVAWREGRWVVIGRDPADAGSQAIALTSDDGREWSLNRIQFPDGSLNLLGLAAGGPGFVAVGANGKLVTSSDGTTWTPRASGTTQTLNAVGWGGGMFLAVGASGTLLTSPDGASWTSRSTGTAETLNAVVSNGSTHVIAAATHVRTSPNGFTWTARTLPAGTPAVQGLAWSGSNFVATAFGTVLTSPDGAAWTPRFAGAAGLALRGAAWTGAEFLVVATDGTILSAAENPRAALPQIDPAGGAFTGTQLVTLSTATGDASLRYTIDGSAPTVGSPLYTAPFTLSAGAAVKARAFAPGLEPSAIADAVFVQNRFPIITEQPQSVTVTPTQTAALTVTAVGGALSYQWYLGQSGDTTVPIDGATAATLVTPPIAEPTTFWVRVSNPTGSASSADITVTPIGQPPAVALTGPAVNGVRSGLPTTISATASDPDGAVARVDFFLDGTLLGTATAAPFAVAWTPSGAGAFKILALATDHTSLVAQSELLTVNVTVGDAPSVSLTAPAAGSLFLPGRALALAADATATGGTVARVEFRVDGRIVATDTTVPYTAVWTPPAARSYTLSARATDSNGLATDSAPVTLAVGPGGTVVAWGAGASTGGFPNFGQSSVPPGLGGVVAIAAGDYHSAALKRDGTVAMWGDNNAGQASVPAGTTGVVAVAAGASHTVALKSDGTVLAWGYNNHGQTNVPPGLGGVAAVAAGLYFSVALKSDGTVAAWGANESGQTTVPADLSGVVAIAASSFHALALKADGTVTAWGSNAAGQRTIPAGLSGVVAVAAGRSHSLALRIDGTVVGWGSNEFGQQAVPAGLGAVVAISAGEHFSTALKSDGTVSAWGRNANGQTTVPAGLSGVSGISAGYLHTLALVIGAVAPEIATPPANVAALAGSSATLSVLATGSAPLRYQWRKGGQPLTGQTNAALTFTVIQASDTGSYDVVVSNSAGSATSSAALLDVLEPPPVAPTISAHPASQSIDLGSSVTFSVVATGAPIPTYQWRKGSTAIPQATNASYTIAAVTSADAGNYSAQVTNSVASLTSETATLTVLPDIAPPVVTAWALGATVGDVATLPAVFTVDFAISDVSNIGLPVLALRFEATGQTTAFATASLLGTEGRVRAYRVAVTLPVGAGAGPWTWLLAPLADSAGNTTTGFGPPAGFARTVTVTGGTIPIAITVPPANVAIAAGATATLAVTATGSAPVYQWYRGASGDTSQPIAGADATTFTTPSLTATTMFWVRVTNTLGAVDSATATVTVAPPPAIEFVVISKSIDHVQTGPTNIGLRLIMPGNPYYGGPFGFGVDVSGEGIEAIVTPRVTLPAGASAPSEMTQWFNGGLLGYNEDEGAWKLGSGRNSGPPLFTPLPADNSGKMSREAMEAAFPNGTYTVRVAGVDVPLTLTGDAYPSIPVFTVSGGTWIGGVYQYDRAQPLPISVPAYAGFGAHVDGVMTIDVDDNNVIQRWASTSPSTAPLTYTIPAHSLPAGEEIIVGAYFSAIVDKSNALPNSLSVALYERGTDLRIRPISGAVPTVAISAPAAGVSLAAGATISLSANATDTDGTVARVDFFVNGALVAIDTTAPFGVSWTPAIAGAYALTARATDNGGAQADSASVAVTVTAGGSSPVVELLAVEKGVEYTQTGPASIQFRSPATAHPGYSGPYYFGAFIEGANLGGLLAPVVTLPSGSTMPTAQPTWFNSGFMRADNDGWSLGTSGGSWDVTTLATLNTLFAPGAYTINVAGVNVPLTLAGDLYPTAPHITLGGGSWSGGVYTFNRSSPVTISITPHAGFGSNVDDHLSLFVDEEQVVTRLYSANPSTAPLTYTIPANALPVNGEIEIEALFSAITDRSAALPGSQNIAVFGTATFARLRALAGSPPTVALTAPAAGANLTLGVPVTLTATATDADGSIAQVAFVIDGDDVLGTATTAPYSITVTPQETGTFTLTARATDNTGLIADSAPVNVTVSATPPPTVALAAPLNGASVPVGLTVTVTATAAPGPGRTLAGVEFFAGTTSLGTDTTTPYAVNWTPTVTGATVLTARATDDLGKPATSAAVTVLAVEMVAPTVLSHPINRTVAAGVDVTFTVVASGTPPLTYQWKKDDVVLPAATSATLALPSVAVAAAGRYHVIVSNLAGHAPSNPATLAVITSGTAATHAIAGTGYFPGGAVMITNSLGYGGTASALGLQVVLPTGWSFRGDAGAGTSASTRPAANETGMIEWTWTTPPPSPVELSYALNVPVAQAGVAAIEALMILRPGGDPLQLLATPDPLLVPVATNHRADTDQNFMIDLFELTRVIELYNTRNGTVRTGCYKIDATGEDGFSADAPRAAGSTAALARYHSADTRGATTGSARDGAIDLFELTRVIELYNTRAGTVRTGQYHVQAGTEDGFAAGP